MAANRFMRNLPKSFGYCLIVMCPDLSGAIVSGRLGNDIAPTPGTTTSSRCIATPAPPAVCFEVYGTPGTVTVRTSPDDVLPTTWMVAVPLKVAVPSAAMATEPALTFPSTRICATPAHDKNGNPPERPAITQRNSPPDDDAVNPSCDVVPRSPSTMPPPLTLGPVAYAADCDARSVLIAKAATMTARGPHCFMTASPLLRAGSPRGGIALDP